nr:HTH domain-containing protein [Natrinema caseinilyticum]
MTYPYGEHHEGYLSRGVRSLHEQRRSEESSRFTETVTLDDVLGVFDTVEGPVVTSGDVAEALDCSRETARRKLRTLEEHGRVAGRKTAGRVVWWIVDEQEPVRGIDPDDSFWEFEPGSSGESDVSEKVDEVLYGKESA